MFTKDVFNLFVQSVLLGEYIIKQGYFNLLESSQELLANGKILDDEKNKLRSVAVKSFNEMTYHLGGVVPRSQHLMSMLNDKYGERQSKYVVNAYKLKHRGVRDENYGHFYDILIEVTYIDHFLSYDESTIQDLILFRSELSDAV